jgi:hypothetical protein
VTAATSTGLSGVGRLASALLATATAALVVSGCQEKRPLPTFRVSFVARSDGDPLAGVRITGDGKKLGSTDEDGQLHVTLRGKEGSSMRIDASCPEGYREAEPLGRLTLRKFRGLDPEAKRRGLEMSVTCPPAKRSLAIIVRTPGQARIPILRRGRELARTDAGGVAHLLFELEPRSTVRLELDTSHHPRLRPRNPGKSFTVPDDDEIVVFDQPFEVEKRKKRRRRRRRRPDPGPVTPTPI